ncbi:MAG TPA: C13 family peptidase [Steroidobacteraceae bacterium]|nr:C13 family peptidase [Steroidobacteraceae bacterium]
MRHAILFSGMTHRRHLNGLEFCYRTLVDRLGFERRNVSVLTHDGSLCTVDGRDGTPACEPWPGDGSPFRMSVAGPGTHRALQRVLGRLHGQLGPSDRLFIYTSGHGGNHGDGRGPELIVHPHWQRYRVGEFCADLGRLPRHRALVVMMSQCFAGGFQDGVLAASRAETTCFVSAASALSASHALADDDDWDGFARHWIAALGGHDVDGARIVMPDGEYDGPLGDARRAFDYANHPDYRDPLDRPAFATTGFTYSRPPSPEQHATATG